MRKTRKILVETTFVLPLREDVELGNGKLHPSDRWRQFESKLYQLFGAWSDVGLVRGVYTSPTTGKAVYDRSRRYMLALNSKEVPRLREFLKKTGITFVQKQIYLSVAGKVELIEVSHEERTQENEWRRSRH